MVKKLINIIIVLPIAIVLIVLSVANRQTVTMAFNPFEPGDQLLSLSAPFFVYLFGALILGMVIGSLATWWTQGKYRKKARQSARDASRWQSEAGTQRKRADELAEQTLLTSSSN